MADRAFENRRDGLDDSGALASELLRAGLAFAGALTLTELVGRVSAALRPIPDVHEAGVAALDDERRLVRAYVGGRSGAEAQRELEIPVDETDLALLADAPFVECSLASGAGRGLHVWLRERGARGVAAAAMRLPDRMLGELFIARGTEAALPPELARFVQTLARLATPVLWNCLTEERFTRGDRRRDALAQLGNSINTSLQRSAVIDATRAALAPLAGDAASALALFNPDGHTYARHPLARRAGGAAQAAEDRACAVAGSVLEWIRANGATFLSDDLAAGPRFGHDAEYLAAGVRRYTATPLRARGQVLGALLMGMADPHPALRIDVSLYENMALQIALALDNAAQHEQVQRLSERLKQQNVYLREEILSEHDFGEMIGDSPALRRLRADIARVGPTESTVLITGETGAGKELCARAIHAASARAAQPMVKVNCAAIPEGTVESELFGHERGAFTSAVERRIGRFELANEATLFLDEIGELPLAVQAKLLRVLQDGEFERVGGAKTIRTNARIIAATNRNLLAAVEAGQFRRDLYYRLNVFPIHVPALVERSEDIPALVEAFVQHLGRKMGKRVESIDRASLDELCARAWPGNVRELKHVIERALILRDGPVLRVEPAAPAGEAREHAPAAEPGPERAAPPREGARPLEGAQLAAVEADHIQRVLRQTGGVIEGPRGAARILGLTPSTLRFRMKRLGIERSRR